MLISCAVPSIITNSAAKQRISGLFRIPAKQNNKNWKNTWDQAGRSAHIVIQKILDESSRMSALHVVDCLMKNLPKDSHIHLASSLAARDFELLTTPEFNSPYSNGEVSVSMNRGVNGIDGVVATAMGTALSSNQQTFAMIGDIAALHDLSSFVVPTSEKKPNITFIVNDNNGGGIFNLLEQSKVSDFERVFGTPTDLNLVQIFNSLGADVKAINTTAELEANIAKTNGIKVLVVKINTRESEANLRKLIFEEVNKSVTA